MLDSHALNGSIDLSRYEQALRDGAGPQNSKITAGQAMTHTIAIRDCVVSELATAEGLHRATSYLDGRIDNVAKNLGNRIDNLTEHITQRFGAVDLRFDAMNQRFEDFKETIVNVIDSRFAANTHDLDRRFAEAKQESEQRFSITRQEGEQRFSTTDQRFAGVDQKLVEFNARMDRLESKIDDMGRALTIRLGGLIVAALAAAQALQAIWG